MSTRRNEFFYVFMSLLLTALSVGNYYLAKSLDVFGTPFFFAIAILGQIFLLGALLFSLTIALLPYLRVVGSIMQSAFSGAAANPFMKQAFPNQSQFLRWMRSRLNLESPWGLPLTLGIGVAVFWLLSFLGLASDVIFPSRLTQVDTRIINLMPSIRTDFQTSFFSYVTFLANWQTVSLLVFGIAAILWMKKKHSMAAWLIAALVGEEVIMATVKQIVRRVRPELALRLIREDSFSFPSGHALRATVLYGLVYYLIYKSRKSVFGRWTIVAMYLATVFMVGLSRIYLGVHFPSDVLASFALGAFILSIFITMLEIGQRFNLWQISLSVIPSKILVAMPLLALLFSLGFQSTFIKILKVPGKRDPITILQLDEISIKQLPLYSETLTGRRMEPIGFVYVGSQNQIESIFESHGWYRSDASTFSNTLKAIAVGFQGGQYLNAPVTPSYLAAKPHDLAFEKPTDSNSLRQRHHTRLWQTGKALKDGRPIWVATASFDEGIEFAGTAKLPTHHIDPNIDGERSFIVTSLQLGNPEYVQVVEAQLGTNASGDAFFTDGRAAIINLR